MPTKKRTRPLSVYLLMMTMLFQGLSGVVGGIGLVADPSGSNMRIPVSWLEGSPFNDYLIPGLILLTVLGVFPLFVVYGLWKRLLWSWAAALLVSLALVIWILVEILIIGYHPMPPLQLIYGGIGIAMIILVLLPSVRLHYSK